MPVDVTGTGKAVVYLYMSDWSDIPWRIFANDKLITRLVSRCYYAYVTEPGQIIFSIGQSEAPGMSLILTANAETIHFVKLKIVKTPMQIGSYPNIRDIDEETALRELADLKRVPIDY